MCIFALSKNFYNQMKRYTLLLCILLSLFSCKKEDGWEEEPEVKIDFEKEQLQDIPPTFDMVGVWEIYMGSYVVGISSKLNMREDIPNGENKHLYCQLFEDKTYVRCMVEYVDSVHTEVETERGTWLQAGDIVRLTSEDGGCTDYKIGEEGYYGSHYAEFFSPYKNKMIFNHVSMSQIRHEMDVEAPEAVPYLKFPFTRVDILSYKYLQWNNTVWKMTPEGELDMYTMTFRSGWHEDESKFITHDMLVLHNHGTIKINQYETCDSVDMYIDDYEVVTDASIVHPSAGDYSMNKFDGTLPYLLPGHHRYPIEYGSKFARIRRDNDNMSPIILWYRTPFAWDIENDLFYTVPSTFDFSDYNEKCL